MNQLRAAMRPVKHWTSFTLTRDFISNRAWIFSGLASIPQLCTMNPRNFLEAALNVHFAGLSLIWYLPNTWKCCSRCWMCCSACKDLIIISSTYTSTDFLKSLVNILFTKCWYVAPAFFNLKASLVAINTLVCDKSYLFFIFNVVVPLIGIHKTEQFIPSCCINQLIYSRQRETIFWIGQIQIGEISTHPPFSLAFLTRTKLTIH